MTPIDPYLIFNGNCAEAMRFYERALGAKLEVMMKTSDAPKEAQVPPGAPDSVLHARLALDGRILMASDDMAGHVYEGMKGFSLSLSCPDVAEGERKFKALAEGGKVTMPFQKTFFSEGFAMLVDRFGTPWMINVQPAKP